MNTLSSSNDAKIIFDRINNLKSSSTPLWGKMTVNEMVCHISDPFRDLLKIRITKNTTPFFLTPILRMMVLGRMAHGKNMPTSKPYLQGEKGQGTKPKGFDTDIEDLKKLYNQYISQDPNEKLGCHGALGNINREQANRYIWKHLDHHLRQFGV
jgi:hypothetical protein